MSLLSPHSNSLSLSLSLHALLLTSLLSLFPIYLTWSSFRLISLILPSKHFCLALCILPSLFSHIFHSISFVFLFNPPSSLSQTVLQISHALYIHQNIRPRTKTLLKLQSRTSELLRVTPIPGTSSEYWLLSPPVTPLYCHCSHESITPRTAWIFSFKKGPPLCQPKGSVRWWTGFPPNTLTNMISQTELNQQMHFFLIRLLFAMDNVNVFAAQNVSFFRHLLYKPL